MNKQALLKFVFIALLDILLAVVLPDGTASAVIVTAGILAYLVVQICFALFWPRKRGQKIEITQRRGDLRVSCVDADPDTVIALASAIQSTTDRPLAAESGAGARA